MSEQQFSEDRLVNDVYQSIRQEQPSADTDREILTGALDMTTRKPSSPFAGNWKVPLSLAAVLVIGLAVVLRLGISPTDHGVDTDHIMSQPSSPAVVESNQSRPSARTGNVSGAASSEIEFIEKVIETESREIEILLQKDKADNEAQIQGETADSVRAYGSINDFMSAEFWVDEIKSLHARGMLEQARKELLVFREAFPDYDAAELENLLHNNPVVDQ